MLHASRICMSPNSNLSHTFPMSAGMFIELVANPIPYVMHVSVPKKSATTFSMSAINRELPVHKKKT